jgi:hypothetical protein
LADKRVKTLKEVVKLIKDSTTSVLTDADAENRVSMGRLLAESHQLFGKPGVLINGLPERPADMVLGWLAQAFVHRHNLRSPAALVYSQLKKGRPPMRAYRENPACYLPGDYLATVGITPPDSSALEDADLPPEEDGDPPAEPAPDPSLLVQVNGRTVLAAWEQAVSLLRAELSPASYQAYLAPARALYWQPPGRLVVGAADEGGAPGWRAA